MTTLFLQDVQPRYDDFETKHTTVEMELDLAREALVPQSIMLPAGPIKLEVSHPGSDDKDPAKIAINMTESDAYVLMTQLGRLLNEHARHTQYILQNRITIHQAGRACEKGLVEELRLTKTDDHLFKIQYMAKKVMPNDPDTVCFEISSVNLFELPKSQQAKVDYLRVLVGGYHDFTSRIKVTFQGFSNENKY